MATPSTKKRVKSEGMDSLPQLQSLTTPTSAMHDSKRSSLPSMAITMATPMTMSSSNGNGKNGSSSNDGDEVRDALLAPLAALGSRGGSDRFSLKPSLSELIRPHIHSFNFLLKHEGGLAQTVKDLRHGLIDPIEGTFPGCSFYIDNITVASPQRTTSDMVSSKLLPRECRELGLSYSGVMTATLVVQTKGPDGKPKSLCIVRPIGSIPLMVRAHRCHLESMNVNELLAAREEGNEQGGYFVVGGIERIIRILILPRRNTVWALVRSAFQNRGKFYTQMATSIRCVRPDQWSKTITVHYLSSGAANLRVSIKKQEFFIPAVYVLRALIDTTDKEIYDGVVQGDTGNAFVTDRTELLIRDGKTVHLPTRKDVLAWIGKSFRLVLRPEDSVTDEDVGRMLIDEHIFIHCLDHDEATRNRAKFNILLYMIQKVYALAQGKIRADNADALSTQEVLLPGHLYGSILKEKLIDWIAGIKGYIKKDLRLAPGKVDVTKDVYWRKAMDAQADIGKRLEHFLKTGTLTSNTGLDLMQVTGFTIIADKLNYVRFLSHFRSVHRGQFFTTMKTTTVRKLLPESWGFMCPVHTPDGSPCGLLNHLAARCDPITHHPEFDRRALIGVLIDLGMVPINPPVVLPPSYLPVLLDGIVVGRLAPGIALRFGHQLRLLKVQAGYGEYKKVAGGNESWHTKPLSVDHSPMAAKVPHTMEIHIVMAAGEPVYPSVILSTDSGRLVRPVQYLATNDHRQSYIEWIGPMEQVYMEIGTTPADFRAGETTHQELYPEIMLSETAMCTPFSDFNQSPRNMYQCQMGKQTMGTPFHSHVHRTDNKSYRLQTPQKPIVANNAYNEYDMDEYPQGANAIVAVISYTGFDMEDAMIINKSSYERGFGHASLYKYKKVDLREERVKGETIHERFKNIIHDDGKKNGNRSGGGGKKGMKTKVSLHEQSLDHDGLPYVGQRLVKDNPYYVTHNDVSDRYASHKFKEGEPAVVDEVRILDLSKENEVQTVGLKLRINRNPIIGDKFSSRHGQKGVLSVLWPQENMPFTESGMSPDVIINPHAFPSRMTIGMLVESLAGKSGALHGHMQSGTPFRFSEKHRAVDHFGKELVAAGYNYAGTEPLYSGISGVEMRAEIYIGVVYYQRLRHMVSDKSQVRSTGPVNSTHRQPVKGRKVGGGIRFGEMERDSLLAHGAAYLLHDRLMMCSDYHTGYVCTLCGSLLSPMMSNASMGNKAGVICRNCETARGCSLIAIPYVFIYLVNELAAMNIRLTLDVKETGAEPNP